MRVGSALVLGLLLALYAISAMAHLDGPADDPMAWPFSDRPPAIPPTGSGGFGDYVITAGVTVLTPDIALESNIAGRLDLDPFFVSGRTDMGLLPAFGVRQSLEAGVDFLWWSSSLDIRATLVPLDFVSAGLGFDLTPPVWVFGDAPVVRIEIGLGAGPEWRPADGITFNTDGFLDLRAGIEVPVGDSRSFDLIGSTRLDARARWPGGFDAVNWIASVESDFGLPWLGDPTDLRAKIRAALIVLPTLVALSDVRIDLRVDGFRAHVVVGIGTGGFAFELGAYYSFGSGR